MFSSSVTVAGGSICLGCQLRAVTRRAAPVLAAAAAAAAQSHDRRRQYASEATKSDSDNDLVAVLNAQKHQEEAQKRNKHASRARRAPDDDWDGLSGQKKASPKPEPAGSSPRQAPSNYHLADILNKQKHSEKKTGKPRRSSLSETATNDWLFEDDRENLNDTKPARSRRDAPLSFPGFPPRSSPEDHNKDARERNARHYDAQDCSAHNHDAWEQATQDSDGGPPFRRVGENRGTSRYEDHEFAAEAAKYRPSKRPGEPNSYRKGDSRLVEDVNKLSGQTLGKPAEVIVLRDGGQWRRRAFREDKRPVDLGFNLTQTDQEEGLGLDLVMDNIEELRPMHRILPSTEFKAVFDLLLNGFTSTQLESYVERQHTREEEGDESPLVESIPDDLSTTRPWILEQSAWSPDVKGALQDIPHPLKGYILKSMPPKQRLVMLLMRECWGMSVQEVMDGQGVLEARLRDTEFKLLTLGNQRWLRSILRIHLSPGGGKSIQVVKSRNAIRIVAPKVVAESCLKALDETLQKTKTRTIRMVQVPMKHLTANMLEELGRLTNSVVKSHAAQKELEVTWIDVRSDPESKLEDLADVVFRLLLTAFTPSRTERHLTVYPEVEGTARLVEEHGSKDHLSWMDRRMQWARLCLPLGTDPPDVSSIWPLSHQNTLKYDVRPEAEDLILPTSTIQPKKEAFYASLAGVPLAFPKPSKEPQPEAKEPEATKPTPSSWLPYRVRTNAVFGHIVNLKSPNVANSIHESTDVLASSSRALSPLIPPVSEMTIPAWVPYKIPMYMTSLILMRFAPYPPNHLAPHLELRIKATDNAIIELDSLRAVAHTHVSDILLPAERVDIRATQRVVAELPGQKIDNTEGMQPLRQFLHDAELEVAEGRLVTPPRIEDLGLPEWMFYQPETDAQSPLLNGAVRRRLLEEAAAAEKTNSRSKTHDTDTLDAYDPASNALRTTSYVFTGLELHRPLETTYDGWRLLYTSVEAGQGGGRRAELSLDAIPGGDRELRRNADGVDAAKFLRSVYRLARGVEGTGQKASPEDWRTEVKMRIGWVGKAKKN